MQVTVTIESTDNAAFEDNVEAEVARILHAAADRLVEHGVDGHPFTLPVRDLNGNTVGSVKVREG